MFTLKNVTEIARAIVKKAQEDPDFDFAVDIGGYWMKSIGAATDNKIRIYMDIMRIKISIDHGNNSVDLYDLRGPFSPIRGALRELYKINEQRNYDKAIAGIDNLLNLTANKFEKEVLRGKN